MYSTESHSPHTETINSSQETEPNENADQDEHEEENEANALDSDANTLFSSIYGDPYSMLSTPSLLRPYYRYPASMDQEQGDDENVDRISPNLEQICNISPQPIPGPSNDETAINDNARNSELNEDIPEGVDPSFLDALPPEMRREVIFSSWYCVSDL